MLEASSCKAAPAFHITNEEQLVQEKHAVGKIEYTELSRRYLVGISQLVERGVPGMSRAAGLDSYQSVQTVLAIAPPPPVVIQRRRLVRYDEIPVKTMSK